jgi:GT2 family glycosyltransferase
MVLDLQDGSNERVSIIVVHHKRPEFLSMCLQSIHVMSNLNNYELIVVDNASNDPDTSDYLDAIEQDGIKVIRNKENLYWSAAANLGASVADKRSKYLIFMHADTIVLNQGWIELMIGFTESKGLGIVGHQMSHTQIGNQNLSFIPEWCVMLTRDCWNDCGPWPEELPLIGNAFIMSVRAQMRGYKPSALNPGQLVHHYKAMSFNMNEFERMNEKSKTIIPRLMDQARL